MSFSHFTIRRILEAIRLPFIIIIAALLLAGVLVDLAYILIPNKPPDPENGTHRLRLEMHPLEMHTTTTPLKPVHQDRVNLIFASQPDTELTLINYLMRLYYETVLGWAPGN